MKYNEAQLKAKIEEAKKGCRELFGGVYEEGSKRRWRCGDDIGKRFLNDGRRNPEKYGKRLCINCRATITNSTKKLLKLKASSIQDENSKTM